MLIGPPPTSLLTILSSAITLHALLSPSSGVSIDLSCLVSNGVPVTEIVPVNVGLCLGALVSIEFRIVVEKF